MTSSRLREAESVLRNADKLYSAAEVKVALDRLATEITTFFKGLDPVILVVMQGGLMPAAWLCERLDFPFRIGYLHVSRYHGGLQGSHLRWLARPSVAVDDQAVLVVDDIFDQGTTLKAITNELRAAGARSVHTAVLVDKCHDRKEPGLRVDFVGLNVDDRYVFGCGMDYKEYFRNLPAIYALK